MGAPRLQSTWEVEATGLGPSRRERLENEKRRQVAQGPGAIVGSALSPLARKGGG